MKISYDWLKDYIDLRLSVEDTAERLTIIGHEVETIEYPDDFSGVVIGLVETVEPIAGSKNRLCKVNTGGRILEIVCGAPNVAKGMLAPVILPGGSLPGGKKVGTTNISGKKSEGMLCSQAELMLGGDESGIWDLKDHNFRNIELKPGADLRKEFPPDAVFKLEITHNRPDCLSHYGIARDLAASLGIKIRKLKSTIDEDSQPAASKLAVEILDAQKCPRYCGRLIEGTVVKDSPVWMQRRLLAVGFRPISNIVDVTNYVLMDLGHPLHAFDFSLIEQNKIVVKCAEEGEKFVTLDDKEHTLTAEDLLICDGKKTVALAGVMGGLNTEIKDSTTDVLLECAYFDPVGVRRTSKRHNIVSDSSYRFERGVDPNAIEQVIDRTASLISELTGGKILAGRVDNYLRKISPLKITLRPRRVNHVLGSRLNAVQITDYLERLGMEVEPGEANLQVKVPAFRPDITQEIDLVEEIARLHGYNKLASVTRSNVSLEVEPLDIEDFDTVLRKALVESGMMEVLTHSMRHSQRSGLGKEIPLSIRNPISEDFALLRKDLISPLLEVTSHNLNHGVESVRIFELGSVFSVMPVELIREGRVVTGLITGISEEIHWSHKEADFDFFSLKGLVENLMELISVCDYEFTAHFSEVEYFEYAGSVTFGEKWGGDFGLLKKDITGKYDIDIPVFVFTFDYDTLMKSHTKVKKYASISRFPAVKRDLSIIFDNEVSAKDIEKIVRESAGEHLTYLRFFDLYKGKQLGAGKKSISISLHFQSAERTLTDEEADITIDNIIKAIESSGGEIRKRQ